MRRRTFSLFLLVSTILGVVFFWPRHIRKTVDRYPPRPHAVKVEPPPKIVVPPKEANGTVPTGWRPFVPPASYLLAPFTLEPTLAQRLPCVDQWVSQGRACEMTESGTIDAVWTWINGSEPILADTRNQEVASWMAKAAKGPRQPLFLGSRQTHFRTHGEMINSMRSVLKSMPVGLVKNYILLTADVAADDTAELRLGSVPTWMDVNQSNGLRVFHHSDVFRIPETSLPSNNDPDREGRAWRDRTVPSFNSLAIESQLPNVPDLSPTIFYLNDDCFLLKPVSAADFETPLYGPVFRIQLDLRVKSRPPGSSLLGIDKEGEWPGLEYTNWLLDQRFGNRKRRYLHHIAKALPAPIMREAAAVWADELANTAEARFRGQGSQVNLVFLATWYTIEMHRESLLYSLIMLRADANADGVFSAAERRMLLAGLTREIPIALREGGSAHYVELNLLHAGIAPPKETEYQWLSSDGYPLIDTVRSGSSAHCKMNVDGCFKPGAVIEVFKRVAFEKPECGDCLIAHLIGRSGAAGLEAFLPAPGAPREPSLPGPPLVKRWQDAEFYSGLGREFAVNKIQRYTYVIGTSPMQFLALRRQSDVAKLPNATSAVTFLAVNDDIKDGHAVRQTDTDMRRWYAQQWGDVRAWWER